MAVGKSLSMWLEVIHTGGVSGLCKVPRFHSPHCSVCFCFLEAVLWSAGATSSCTTCPSSGRRVYPVRTLRLLRWMAVAWEAGAAFGGQSPHLHYRYCLHQSGRSGMVWYCLPVMTTSVGLPQIKQMCLASKLNLLW